MVWLRALFKREVLHRSHNAPSIITPAASLPPASDDIRLKVVPRCYGLNVFVLQKSIYWSPKEMATHSSILAWRIPWTEGPGGLQSMGSQRVGQDWTTKRALVHTHAHTCTHTHKHILLSFSPLLFTSLLSSTVCKASWDNHFAFLLFFFFEMVLFAASCVMVQTSAHSSLGTLH